MFIIWGMGHRTIKKYGVVDAASCGVCNNNVRRELIKVTTWFTLFFIPIIPYSKKYFIVCPICSAGSELTKDEFFSIVDASGVVIDLAGADEGSGENAEKKKYAGKTATQINYLKQMDELRDK